MFTSCMVSSNATCYKSHCSSLSVGEQQNGVALSAFAGRIGELSMLTSLYEDCEMLELGEWFWPVVMKLKKCLSIVSKSFEYLSVSTILLSTASESVASNICSCKFIQQFSHLCKIITCCRQFISVEVRNFLRLLEFSK